MAEREERRSSTATVSDEKRYAILSKESVKLMADAAGHEAIHDTVAGILGEDVSYRLREITQKSAQFMRHAKRKRMNTEDFNKACRCSDIQPVLGHGSTESCPTFHQVKLDQGESKQTIHYASDSMVNLAAASVNDYMPKHLGETTIKAHWLITEGVQKTSQNPHGTGNKPEASATLMKYLEKTTQAVQGYDEEMMKTALSDLRCNGKISPLLPHFVSFIANGVKTLSHDTRQLRKLLFMVRSLVCNCSLFLEAQPFLPTLTQSVQYCLLESVSSFTPSMSSCDHWAVRDYAARLLAHIVSIWGSGVNHLERFTEKALREVLYDHSKPFASHYGAVMGLLYLGSESIERVLLPHLSSYLPHVFTSMQFQGKEYVQLQEDASKVHDAIMLSVEHVLRKYIKQFKEQHVKDPSLTSAIAENCKTISNFDSKQSKPSASSGFMSMFHKSPIAFYNEMSEYFGDSLTLRLPEILELRTQVFTRSRPDLSTGISDPEAHKSGEELLNELMEQVKPEQGESKHDTQHKCEQLKQKREVDEKKVRARLKKDRRTADNRHMLQMVYQRKLELSTTDSDAELDVVDVEGDHDHSLHSQNTEPVTDSSGLAVASTMGVAPRQGIKLTFTKRSKFSPGSALVDSPASAFTEIKDKDVKRSSSKPHKRKHSSTSSDTGMFNMLPSTSDLALSASPFFPEFDSDNIFPSSKYRKKD